MTPPDDADDDAVGGGPPLPPDDRLWRHPSEVARHGPPTGRAVPPPPVVVRGGPSWPVTILAGSVGAVLAMAVLAATGGLTREVEKPVTQKVAVTPVVSSPMVRGERGVAAVAALAAPTVVRISLARSGETVHGSGVVIRDDGLVLTSASVVGDTATVRVTLADGEHHDGTVVGIDAATDVALVDVDVDDLPVAVLGDSSDLEVGVPTIAVTAVHRDDPAVVTGVISALGRRVETTGGLLHGVIETDAPVDAAGGPLLDARGVVIGITAAPVSASDSGFAIPIDLARRVVDELLTSGRVSHPWLGIEGTDLSDDEAIALGVGGGAKVDGVAPASPADAAGLEEDDVITEVDGDHVASSSELVTSIRAHEPGDEIVVGYWHDGEHHHATVTVGDKPG